MITVNLRKFSWLISVFFAGDCCSQIFPPGDSLTLLQYDTIRIETEGKINRFELENKKQFSFCSQLYDLPKDCEASELWNCCKYSTNVYEMQTQTSAGSVNCLNAFKNGYNLTWFYTNDISDAKSMIDTMLNQFEKQVSSFKKKEIKCFVLNKEFPGFLCEFTYSDNTKMNHILTYGSFKHYNFSLQYSTTGSLKDTNDLPETVKKMLAFE